jgi:hypothetical protein
LTMLSTMVSKLDHTVDYAFKNWPDCRLLKKKIQRLSTSQKEILQQSIYNQKSTVDFKARSTPTVTSKQSH